MPRPADSPEPTAPQSGPGAWLFPGLLFAYATLFFGGRLGWWSDDYWHNQRDAITGQPEGWIIRRGFFLRPLFYRIVPPVTTWSWRSQWPAHVLEALQHAAVVVVLWRLMVSLGATRRAAAAAALLFMVYPAQFETIFWVSAIPTSLACLLMLTAMFVMVWFARERIGWWAAGAVPVLVFALCCLNEQPAAGVAALPLVYWAALPGSERRGAGWRMHLVRALAPAALGAAAAVAYALLVLLDPNKVAGTRGSVQSMITAKNAWPHLLTFTDVLWRRLVLKNFAQGSLLTGFEQVRATGLIGAAWAVGLVAAAALWLRSWVRGPAEQSERSMAPMAIAGLVIFLTGWFPIYIFAAYEPDSRTRYWPCIGMAITIGAGLSAVGPRLAGGGRSFAARLSTGLALCIVLCLSATMLVGTQAGFRARFARDRAEGEQLRALVPDPPPITFFLPIRVDEAAVHTRSPVFDRHFRSVWEFPWTGPKFIAAAYRRLDLRCGYWYGWWPGVPVRGANEEGIHYTDRLGPRFPPIEGSGSRIPWDRVLPFVIDGAGQVRIVTRVVFPGNAPGSPPVERRIPLAPAGAPDFAVRLRRG